MVQRQRAEEYQRSGWEWMERADDERWTAGIQNPGAGRKPVVGMMEVVGTVGVVGEVGVMGGSGW